MGGTLIPALVGLGNSPRTRVSLTGYNGISMHLPHHRLNWFVPAEPTVTWPDVERESAAPKLCEALAKYSDSPHFDLRARPEERWLWDARSSRYRRVKA